MDKKIKLLNLVKAGLILSFFTPLVLAPIGITLSAYPKAVFFRTVIEITFIFYLLLLLQNSKYLPRISILSSSCIIFIGILGLTSLTSLNPARSFWGTMDRGEGYILHLHLLAFFLMLIGIFNTKEEWFKLLKLAFIVSVLSSGAGILQKLGLFTFYGNSLPQRISGTLANPDFFGAYMSLSIFLGIIVFLFEKEKDYRILWLLFLFLNFLTLILSHTRAAWGGLIIGLLFFSLLLTSRYSPFSPNRKKIIFLAILILIGLGILIIINYKTLGLDRYFLFRRLLSSFDIVNTSRFFIWQIAIKLWQESPIIGSGPEMFGYLFDKNIKISYQPHIGEFYYDYPHSKFLGLLSDSGILGLLSFLSIFFISFNLIFKNVKEKFFGDKSPLLVFCIASFFLVYLVQNIFAFDTIAIYLLLFLMIAFVNNNFYKSDANLRIATNDTNNLKNKYVLLIIIIPLILVSLAAIYQINIKPTLASIQYVKAIKLANQGQDFKEILESLKKTVSYKTVYDQDFKLEVAKALIIYIETGRSGNLKRESINFLYSLKDDLERRTTKPEIRYITSHEVLAKIYEISFLEYKKEDDIILAENILQKALNFNDQHSRLWRFIGEIKIVAGDYKEGEGYYQRAFEMGPKGDKEKIELYKNLGRAYYLAGEKKKSADNFKKGIDISFSLSKTDPSYIVVNPINEQELMFWESVALIYLKELKDSKTFDEIYQMAMEAFPQYKEVIKTRFEELGREN